MVVEVYQNAINSNLPTFAAEEALARPFVNRQLLNNLIIRILQNILFFFPTLAKKS